MVTGRLVVYGTTPFLVLFFLEIRIHIVINYF